MSEPSGRISLAIEMEATELLSEGPSAIQIEGITGEMFPYCTNQPDNFETDRE